MPRTRKIIDKSEEALNSKVNPTGAGEDPVVRDLLNGKIANASDREALDMALALQQIIRGQNSLLENQRELVREIEILKREASARDEASRKWQEDQQKFLDDVRNQAEKLRVTGAELEKLKANAALDTEKLMKNARAQARAEEMDFDLAISKMPKRMVISPGVLLITTVDGHQASRIVPEEIKIKHRTWRLPPGQLVEVPEVVAEALSTRMKDRQQTAQLEQAMASNLEASELRNKIAEIRNKTEAPYDPDKAPSPI